MPSTTETVEKEKSTDIRADDSTKTETVVIENAPELEVVYTFTWGRNRAQSNPKGQGRRFSEGASKEGEANAASTEHGERRNPAQNRNRKARYSKPEGEHAAQDSAGQPKSGEAAQDQTKQGQQKFGRDKFNRDNDRRPGKSKPRRDEGPKQFLASPKKTQQIDPDNPFAAALMGLKDKI